MKELTILADDVRVQANGNQVEVSMYKPVLGSIPAKELVKHADDLYELFLEIVEVDDEILQDYLQRAGYIYNKG